jgi:hypothetical protein
MQPKIGFTPHLGEAINFQPSSKCKTVKKATCRGDKPRGRRPKDDKKAI